MVVGHDVVLEMRVGYVAALELSGQRALADVAILMTVNCFGQLQARYQPFNKVM